MSSAKTHIGWLQTAVRRQRKLALEQAAMPLPFRERVRRETATEKLADAQRAVYTAARELADVERADLGEVRERVARSDLADAKQVLREAVQELKRLGMGLPKRPEGWVKFYDAKGDPYWRHAGPGHKRNSSMPVTI